MDHAEGRQHPEAAEKQDGGDITAHEQMGARPERERGQHRMADNRVDTFAGGDFVMKRIHTDQRRVFCRDAAQEKEDRKIHQDQDDRRAEQVDIPDAMIGRCVIGVDHPIECGNHQD